VKKVMLFLVFVNAEAVGVFIHFMYVDRSQGHKHIYGSLLGEIKAKFEAIKLNVVEYIYQ
jgi:hypothetical protein